MLAFLSETSYPRDHTLSIRADTHSSISTKSTNIEQSPKATRLPWVNFHKTDTAGLRKTPIWETALHVSQFHLYPNIAIPIIFYSWTWYWVRDLYAIIVSLLIRSKPTLVGVVRNHHVACCIPNMDAGEARAPTYWPDCGNADRRNFLLRLLIGPHGSLSLSKQTQDTGDATLAVHPRRSDVLSRPYHIWPHYSLQLALGGWSNWRRYFRIWHSTGEHHGHHLLYRMLPRAQHGYHRFLFVPSQSLRVCIALLHRPNDNRLGLGMGLQRAGDYCRGVCCYVCTIIDDMGWFVEGLERPRNVGYFSIIHDFMSLFRCVFRCIFLWLDCD